MTRPAALAILVLALLWQPGRTAAQEEAAGALPDATVQQAQKKKKKKKKKRVRVGGYLQAFYRYTLHTGEDEEVDADNFRLQRVRIQLTGKVIKKVSYQVEVDPRAPEVRGILRDAFIQFKHIPFHKLRVGQQKTQFGYENLVSSSELFAVNRTELSENIARGPNLRDVGLGLIGKIPVGAGVSVEDAITVVNGNGLNTQIDDTELKTVWGRLGARYDHPDDLFWVRAGLSGGHGDFMDEGDDPLDPADDFLVEFDRVGVDAEVDTEWVFASAEYARGSDDAEGETTEPSGWYLNLVGKTPWHTGPIVRYDRFDLMEENFRRWTLGAYYGDPDDRLRFLLNYEYRKVKDDVRGDDRLFLWSQVRF